MINLNENHLKLLISLEILNLFQDIVRADSHLGNAKAIGQYCWSSTECQVNSYCLQLDESHKVGTCQCLPGYIKTHPEYWIQCIEPKQYYQSCEYSLQCQHFDRNTVCDTETGHFILKCLCNDYHRYSTAEQRCVWCDSDDCRRFHQRYSPLSNSYNERYNRWYHNVNGLFGVWASLIIIALPICLFLFFLGIRFTKQLIRSNANQLSIISQTLESNTSGDSTRNERRVYVTLPPEVIPLEMPPSYEQLSKSIRLPTYEEAMNNPLINS